MSDKDKKQWLALIAGLGVLFLGVLVYLSGRPRGLSQAVLEAGLSSSETTPIASTLDSGLATAELSSPAEGPFYLVGEVRHPGVYTITEGQYLYELVELAGGLTEEADRLAVNLAAEISPGGMFRIPSVEEGLTAPVSAEPAVTGTEAAGTTKIGINSATAADLEQIPGIGPSTAQAILDLRESQGRFTALEDLMLVPGIKEKRFEQLKDYVYLD